MTFKQIPIGAVFQIIDSIGVSSEIKIKVRQQYNDKPNAYTVNQSRKDPRHRWFIGGEVEVQLV